MNQTVINFLLVQNKYVSNGFNTALSFLHYFLKATTKKLKQIFKEIRDSKSMTDIRKFYKYFMVYKFFLLLLTLEEELILIQILKTNI